VINLHWINAGFLNLGMIGRIRQPVVWTLHDMWPFTGVCHYSDGCRKFRDTCGACPMLESDRASDLSRWNWRRKRDSIGKMDLTIVTPSRWLAGLAGESRILGPVPVEVIPNGVDIDVFRPAPKTAVRKLLGLDRDKKVVLFGGAHALTDPRKGARFLSHALEIIKNRAPETPLQVLVFGAEIPETGLTFHFETRYLGFIRDERLLAQMYAAADVYVTPPTEENLANTVIEALACGTPTVAFDVGGMAEMVLHGKNGYLARASDATDLARGIQWALESTGRLKRLSREARETAIRNFDILESARRYHLLFEKLAFERKR
jgi:glycosyltransferase involved in cell wall biosynthesis